MSEGIVYLVGAGPGDPGLLTLRARELIAEADVLVYDYLVNERILGWRRDGCEMIFVGKKPGRHSISQEEIGDLLADHAAKGKRVVRLKGGDPFVFGRGGEEAPRLAEAGVNFEIVPGVTAALAAAAFAGIPLTHRDLSSSLCFLTGHEKADGKELQVKFRDFAHTGGTLCIYMGMGRLKEIAGELIDGGLPAETPVAVVQWASLPRQKGVLATLGTVADKAGEKGLDAPAIIVVGEVARFYNDMGRCERMPLFGRRVIVTRNLQQASSLSAKLEEAGAEVLVLPLIKINPAADPDIVEEVFSVIGEYDWLVFTSANGVKHFLELFLKKFHDLRALGLLRIGVVGPATARALYSYHIRADLIPAKAVGEALADAMIAQNLLDNLKILVVTGNLSSDVLVKKLEKERAIVDTLQVYETQKTDLSEHPAARLFRDEGADAVIFASSSAVKSFVAQGAALSLEPEALKPLGISIGPLTSKAMRECGLDVDVEAADVSIDSLVEAVCKKLGKF